MSYTASLTSIKPRLPMMLVGSALAAAFGLVLLGPNAVGGRTEAPQAPLVAERMLTFADQPDKGVAVLENGKVIAVYEGEQGFIRGILRGMNRGRKMNGISREIPFHLAAYADGRLVLEDPATHTRLDMAAYGATNEATFADLLPIPGRLPPPAQP